MVVSERVFVKTGAGAFHLAPVPLEGRLHSGKLGDEGVGDPPRAIQAQRAAAEEVILFQLGMSSQEGTLGGSEGRTEGVEDGELRVGEELV